MTITCAICSVSNRTPPPLIRQQYWSRYGATLRGLMRNHDTDPGIPVAHAPVPELKRMLVASAAAHDAAPAPGSKVFLSKARCTICALC